MTEAPFEIWVGNLASYVDGKLDGKWISLPQNEKDLQAALAEISRNGEDEIAIMDYSFRPGCRYISNCISEWSNINQLNMIAKLIGDEEHIKVEAYLDNNSELLLPEIANLFMQEEKIPFYPYEFEGSNNPDIMNELSDEEKMGYTLVERDIELKNRLEELTVGGMTVLDYLDVGAIGRDYSLSGYATLYENGYYNLSESGPDLHHYTMEEIAEEIAAREQDAKEKQEEEIQEEEIVENTVKEKTLQKLTEKAPSL